MTSFNNVNYWAVLPDMCASDPTEADIIMVSPDDTYSDADPHSPRVNITATDTTQKGKSQLGRGVHGGHTVQGEVVTQPQPVQEQQNQGNKQQGRGVSQPKETSTSSTSSPSSSTSTSFHTSASPTSLPPTQTPPITQLTTHTPSTPPYTQNKHVSFKNMPPLQIQAVTQENTEAMEERREHYYGVLKNRMPRTVPKSSKLKVAVQATFADGSTKMLQALVDTGAEVSLINPTVLDPSLFQPSPKPVRLGVANSHRLPGGSQQTTLVLTFDARDQDTGLKRQVGLPLTAYDAAVVCDIILSYRWMAENNVMPNPRRHGIYIHDSQDCLWVPGIITPNPHDITVLEGLPIHIMEGQTPPASPRTQQEVEAMCNQISTQWVHREHQENIIQQLKHWDLHTQPQHPGMGFPDIPGLAEETDTDPLLDDDLEHIATVLKEEQADIHFVKGFVQAREAIQGNLVDTLKQGILKDYATTVFLGKTSGNPPKRGILGEAAIIMKPNAVPVKQRPFQMVGERRTAWVKLTDQILAEGKIEPGQGPWCSPSFPVPKKKPGEYRLVVDFRKLNEATEVDAHPLPKIGDILQRQGKFRIWSVLDMKDGYHQVPLKEQHRNLTCMSTPRGSMRWKVLVMGLKNGNAIFQRVMEDVRKDFDFADAYVDDVIVGSTGDTEEELLMTHDRDLRKVMEALKDATMIADPKKM